MPARITALACSRLGFASALVFLSLFPIAPPARAEEPSAPIASAFVFPVGDELDFKKPAAGESNGFHVSDPYLAIRNARKHRARRVHYGTDLSAGQSGLTVRAIAAGVVDVSDGKAMIKVQKAERVKVPAVVNGKRVDRWSTKYRTVWKWRTGWGNRVVIRHKLPDGQVVYSLYAHLLQNSVLVRTGDVVAAGQPIARVGRTGRATAPHLHLEIRTRKIDDSAELTDPDDSECDECDSEGRGETQIPHTVDPLAFLVDHVLKFKDLEPGSWQARYALAAVKDGMFGTQREKFDPNDEITRGEFYAALVAAFHLGTPFTKNQFDSNVDALIDTGMLDAASRSRQEEHGRVTRSEALELILRCLDRGMAHGPSMGRIAADQLARDFNVQFAGKGAAEDAEREARKLATDETAARKTAAIERADQRAKDARRRGAPPPKRNVKVDPVKPIPILDPGFDSLAQSDKELTRAEVCLLLASALRIGSANVSALQRAATRAAKTG